jgi:chromosome segregation ATPase
VAILKVLENKLDQAIVRYNEITSKNGQLRHQIDLLRKDIYTSREVQRKLEEKIGKIKKTAVTKNTNTNKLQTNTESINVQVMVLQQKYNKDKEEFKFEMNKLVSQLKEKDESRVIEEKGQSMEMTKTKSIIKGKGDFTNPLEIINMRLTNWKARNRDKKRIIDNYLRNVNILKDAFEEIQKV